MIGGLAHARASVRARGIRGQAFTGRDALGMVKRISERLVGLPEAATRLGVHRATVNDMVQAGRIPARRVGPHWFIQESDLRQFAQTYQRPRNAPRRLPRAPVVSPEILTFLAEWGEATVAELAAVVDMHEGNIRKHLCLAEAQGLAQRDEFSQWRATAEGRRRAVTRMRI